MQLLSGRKSSRVLIQFAQQPITIVIVLQSAAIHENIGYPDWINNDTRPNAEYSGVSTLQLSLLCIVIM